MGRFKVIDGHFKCKQKNEVEFFDCSFNDLTSLEGCPKKVKHIFACNYNRNLTSLEGCPSNTMDEFLCTCDALTTLKGCPKRIEYNLYCQCNRITTLEGGPKYVGEDFICFDNNLTTLKGCPEYIGHTFDCRDNEQLEDISDLPSMVYNLWISNCPKLKIFTKEITNKLGYLCIFVKKDDIDLIQKIKSWPYYKVINEYYDELSESYIVVKIKSDNELFMNSL